MINTARSKVGDTAGFLDDAQAVDFFKVTFFLGVFFGTLKLLTESADGYKMMLDWLKGLATIPTKVWDAQAKLWKQMSEQMGLENKRRQDEIALALLKEKGKQTQRDYEERIQQGEHHVVDPYTYGDFPGLDAKETTVMTKAEYEQARRKAISDEYWRKMGNKGTNEQRRGALYTERENLKARIKKLKATIANTKISEIEKKVAREQLKVAEAQKKTVEAKLRILLDEYSELEKWLEKNPSPASRNPDNVLAYDKRAQRS